MIPGYYIFLLFSLFLAFLSIGYYNIALKVIAEIGKHDDIATMRCDRAENTSGRRIQKTFCKQAKPKMKSPNVLYNPSLQRKILCVHI